ncbi:hypothetical protein [Pseudomonas graminis]
MESVGLNSADPKLWELPGHTSDLGRGDSAQIACRRRSAGSRRWLDKLGLWAVLLLGVAALAAMACRLLRKPPVAR